MKKIVLSLAGVMAAVAFAPEASAVPAFARQTGSACSACHFQHFPLLNAYGRAFKSSGFTMMGAQGKVEDEHLDIPNQLNTAVFTTTFVERKSGTAKALNIGVPTTGGEFSLFMGGRASEFAGFIAEAGFGGNGAANTGGVVGASKVAMLFPVGDARMGLVIHSSNGQGVAYSFELLNTGAANTHKLMGNSGPAGQHVKTTSAAQYLNTNTAATGVSLVANNGMGFVNIGKYKQAGNQLVGGANEVPLTYIRAAGIMDIAGWDAGFGVQRWSGRSDVTLVDNDATVIDGQMQGELIGMPVGFYASYGIAAKSSATDTTHTNAFNASTTNDTTSLNVAAEFGVIPHTLTAQVAVRSASTGGLTDNAVMVGTVYELAQNIGLSLHHTVQSGSFWDNQAAPVGKDATTLLMEVLF